MIAETASDRMLVGNREARGCLCLPESNKGGLEGRTPYGGRIPEAFLPFAPRPLVELIGRGGVAQSSNGRARRPTTSISPSGSPQEGLEVHPDYRPSRPKICLAFRSDL